MQVSPIRYRSTDDGNPSVVYMNINEMKIKNGGLFSTNCYF